MLVLSGAPGSGKGLLRGLITRESGRVVELSFSECSSSFWGVLPSDILVVHDDADSPQPVAAFVQDLTANTTVTVHGDVKRTPNLVILETHRPRSEFKGRRFVHVEICEFGGE